MVDWGFNIIKCIFIQIFVQVDPMLTILYGSVAN